MRVQYWGTRGSIATPGPGTVRYGGNTSCVSVLTKGGTRLILDAGTGLRGLGKALTRDGEEARGHLLIGHTHWDHIQGFPFFDPLFCADNEWDIYAPRGFGSSLRETLAGQMQYAYFPVSIDAMGATIRYHELVEGSFTIGDATVTTRYLNHPALTLGYRIEADGITLVYSSDHECHARTAALGQPLEKVLGALHPGDSRHLDFVAGADLLIHDAQYTAAEYPARAGWGHSTMEYVVDLAMAGGVRRLDLYHHDPARDDMALDKLLESARQRVALTSAALQVHAATEGVCIDLEASVTPAEALTDTANAPVDTENLARKDVLVCCSDSGLRQQVEAIVRSEGFNFVGADTPQQAMRSADRETLGLAVLEQQPGSQSASALAAALREREGMEQLPVIMLAGAPTTGARHGSSDLPDGALPSSAITEWLPAHFTPNYLRTKLRAGLLRTRARWQAAPAPADEAQRLQALRRLALLDSEPEERFDRITRLAGSLFDVPIALISLVDEDRQWFKSQVGLQRVQQTPRDVSFCAHAILQTQALVVPDALGDDRFAENPLVRAEPRVRFYAGQPIAAPDGSLVGTLCLIDHKPRQFADSELRALRELAAMVESEMHEDD